MACQRLVALNVLDEDGYQAYRAGMTPILRRYGGKFGYDFKVSEVLQSQSEGPINRVFTICFPDRQAMDSFFSDPSYLEVRSKHFDHSVAHATIIATFEA